MFRLVEYKSPVATLVLGALRGRLCLCDWKASRHFDTHLKRLRKIGIDDNVENPSIDIPDLAIKQLNEYFSGHRSDFDLPLQLYGTPFQLEVWRELLSIAYGDTISYADLAKRLGRPEAVRAVAAAVGLNPISIIVPCHRVVGSDGSLTGYAGGISAKQSLLTLESHNNH